MKHISALALVAFMSISPAIAGGLAPVIVEDQPVVETGPASSVSPLLILGLLILIGVLVSRNDDNESRGNTPPLEEEIIDNNDA